MKADIYKIQYRGHEYDCMEVEIFQGTKDADTVVVASVTLEEHILDDMQSDVLAPEAMAMDETIAYYLTDEEFLLPYNEIVELVEASYL